MRLLYVCFTLRSFTNKRKNKTLRNYLFVYIRLSEKSCSGKKETGGGDVCLRCLPVNNTVA